MLVLQVRRSGKIAGMTQHLIDHFNSHLDEYNAALDAKIAATPNSAERRRLAALKFAPLRPGEVSEGELRRRLRIQRLRLGRVLKTRAVELLRHIEPSLCLDRYTVGLSYARIIEILRQEFPEAEVSTACLRWYVGKINETARDLGTGKTGLPQWRPRSGDSHYEKNRTHRHWRKVRAERRAAQATLQQENSDSRI